MEEESVKFDVLTILIVIAIVVIGYLLYRSPVENSSDKLGTDQSQNSTVSGTYNELDLLTTSSYVSGDCEFLLNEYLYLVGISEGSPKELLIELNLLTDPEFENLRQNSIVQISGNNYVKTKISYETFKNKMLDYVTEDLFSKEFSSYKNYDGFVALAETGTTDTIYEINGMELTSYNNNLYTFNVQYTIQPSDGRIKYLTVTFLDSNGEYFLSDINFDN